MFKRIKGISGAFSLFIFLSSTLFLFDGSLNAQALTGDSIVHVSLQQAIELGLKNSYNPNTIP